MTLQEIGIKHGAGKCSHSYMPTYERLLRHLQSEPITLLEIGIDHGGCLNMWAEFFPHAKIFGLDNHLAYLNRTLDSRVTIHDCSYVDPKIQTLFQPESLDVVVEDANHNPDEQKACARLLWPCLKPGGWYFVEDIQPIEVCRDWSREYRHFRMFTWDFHRHSDRDWQPDDILIALRKEPIESNPWKE